MLKKIEVENFMSLKDVSVPLEPLTVFIGPNASGKSAIFKALVTVSKLLNGATLRGGKRGEFALEEGVTLDDAVWSGNSGLPVRFRLWLDDDGEEPGYRLELRKKEAGWSVTRERFRAGNGFIEVDEDHPFQHPTERQGEKIHKFPSFASLRVLLRRHETDSAARPVIEPILQLCQRIGQTWRYRPSASDIARFVERGQEAAPLYVRPNGWGVAAELQDLQGSKRELFQKIEDGVRKLFPHIRTIGFKSDRQGVRLSFTTD